MSFADYLYFALLIASLFALPGAVRALPAALRHWQTLKSDEHPRIEATAAGYAVLVSAGIMLHAIEEVLYKSGRITQFFQGINTSQGANIILDAAAICGIASLTLAIYYLNQGRTRLKRAYWVTQGVLVAAVLAV